MPEALLTCQESARLLNVRPATIRAWTHQRRIPYVKVNGRTVRYRLSDLEKLVRSGLRPALRPLREPAPADPEGGER